MDCSGHSIQLKLRLMRGDYGEGGGNEEGGKVSGRTAFPNLLTVRSPTNSFRFFTASVSVFARAFGWLAHTTTTATTPASHPHKLLLDCRCPSAVLPPKWGQGAHKGSQSRMTPTPFVWAKHGLQNGTVGWQKGHQTGKSEQIPPKPPRSSAGLLLKGKDAQNDPMAGGWRNNPMC